MRSIIVLVRYPLKQDENGTWYNWYQFKQMFTSGISARKYAKSCAKAVQDIGDKQCPIEYFVNGYKCAQEDICAKVDLAANR
jgi:hypothetical protein